MRFEIDDDGRITDQAAQWLGAMLQSSERREELFAWLAKSPQHVEDLTCMVADFRDIASLQPEDIERIERLARELGTDEAIDSNVVPISQRALGALEGSATRSMPSACDERALADASTGSLAPMIGAGRAERKNAQRPVARRHVRWMSGLAAALLIAATGVWWFTGPGSWRTYSTKVGEQLALELADGSVVHLNTDSEIAVRLSATTRSVRLDRGEALFAVEHDAKRPFLVHSGDAVIQAIGTRFDVYRRAQSTRVAVVEGLVQISASADPVPAFPVQRANSGEGPSGSGRARLNNEPRTPTAQLLAAGQVADISSHGEVARRNSVDAVKTVAWRQRRLVFENETLGNIAAEFNRYNAEIKIRVLGAASDERFTATFDAGKPEAIMQGLADDPALLVERVGSEIVIQNRVSESIREE